MPTSRPAPQIRFAALSFDPLTERPVVIKVDGPGATAPESSLPRTIVQFHGALTVPDQTRLKQTFGLALRDYVPDYAYLERLTLATLEKLARDPLLRATVPYHAAFKIVPGIGAHEFTTDERRAAQGLWVTCVLFRDADPELVGKAIEALGATQVVVVDDRRAGGAPKINLIVDSAAALPAIAALPEVKVIEEVPEAKDDNVNTAGTNQSGVPTTQSVWTQGLHGEGQIIGVIERSPLDIAHCFFQDPVDNTPRLAHRKVLQLRNNATITTTTAFHGTFVAGCAAGDDFNIPGLHPQRGGAWAARLAYGPRQDVFDGSMFSELTKAASVGATIHTNSWHDANPALKPAKYNQHAADVDDFTWKHEDHLVLGSAGNSGEEQGPPGTAKNAICVCAARADPSEMTFGDGNTGPTADGRRKPDLTGVGCRITSSDVGSGCGTRFFGGCATSFATPHIAACAALARQYYTEGFYPTGTKQPHHAFTPSGALLKATLINGTIDMTGPAGYPSDLEGWGLIRLQDSLPFPGSARTTRVWDSRHATGIGTGDVREHHLDVIAGTQPLRITLVWSDAPGGASSAAPVVNDLNLEVVAPGGATTFLGNDFANGVSTTGGAADSLNNVEMVLVNSPTPGDWIIRVVGAAVNVGPLQGYAIVASGDLAAPPISTGVQDTLVVRVKFADIAPEASFPNLQAAMGEVANYIDRVSYGQATVVASYRGSIELDQPKDYYYDPSRNLLIELTEEVVAKLDAAEPNVLSTVERLIIVTNDVNFTGDWATTGPWPYELPGGFTRPISVSVQSHTNPAPRFTHGMLHQFGLVDLYPHEGVTFPRPYVDEWDNMAGFFNNVHPLTWSKERAGWLTAHGDTIQYIPRPAPGNSFNGPNPIPLFFNTSTAANRKAIAIGLSQNAPTIGAEKAFYFIEARRNTNANFDNSLPGTGVLVYYVNQLIPQGQGPVILRDKNLLTLGLADAFFVVGDFIEIPGTGINLTVLAGTGGAAFDIQVDYTAPVTDYNLFITAGDTIGGKFKGYMSPDIWIDSPKKGFQLSGGPPPNDKIENPVAKVVNRIHARIHNEGPAAAFDFDVRFRVSEPYHTVGGEADFDNFVAIKHVDVLAAGADLILFAEWTPEAADPHACVLVDMINLVGTDTNPFDNIAQENLKIVASVTSSPFHPVSSSFSLKNPYDRATLFYFRADGAPKGWKVDLNPRKILLDPGERIVAEAIITPPPDAKVCTSEHIDITSWAARGDTLINVGGAVVQVDLRRPQAVSVETHTGRCTDKDWQILITEAKNQGKNLTLEEAKRLCGRFTVKGCTNPKQPNQEIILKYVDPLGNVTFHTVTTDANGCYEDFMASVTGGTWEVTAEYPGGRCEAPAVGGPVTACWCR